MPVYSGATLPGATITSTTGMSLSLASFGSFDSSRYDVRVSNSQGFQIGQVDSGRYTPRSFSNARQREVVVRAPFADSPVLTNWANQVIVNGATSRSVFTVSRGNQTVLTTAAGGGFPSAYIIRRAPDGTYYEEWTLVGDSV
jgi:hypothetical protein